MYLFLTKNLYWATYETINSWADSATLAVSMLAVKHYIMTELAEIETYSLPFPYT